MPAKIISSNKYLVEPVLEYDKWKESYLCVSFPDTYLFLTNEQ